MQLKKPPHLFPFLETKLKKRRNARGGFEGELCGDNDIWEGSRLMGEVFVVFYSQKSHPTSAPHFFYPPLLPLFFAPLYFNFFFVL